GCFRCHQNLASLLYGLGRDRVPIPKAPSFPSGTSEISGFANILLLPGSRFLLGTELFCLLPIRWTSVLLLSLRRVIRQTNIICHNLVSFISGPNVRSTIIAS